MQNNFNFIEIIKYGIELIVLIIILREIIALKKHKTSLEKHSKALDKVRPLYTTLYTDGDDILKLAIEFLKQAKVCYAFGAIESLLDAERGIDESQSDFQERIKNISNYKIDYVNETENFILSCNNYYRIMDFRPSTQDNDNKILISNILYFIRLLEFSGTKKININLYHNPDIPMLSGEFHFRCSDSQVVIRAGGHGNTYTNNAIVITDSRVVQEYQRYYQSVIDSVNTKEINIDTLILLKKYYLECNFKSINILLQNFTEKRDKINKNKDSYNR